MIENGKSSLAESTEGRERLMQAAYELFSERGYADVPIHEIAEAAGMTRSAPYYHFRNKEELYAAVMRREITRAVDMLLNRLENADSFRGQLIAIIRTFIETSTSQFGRFMSDFRRHMSMESKDAIMKDGPLPTELFGPVFAGAHARGEYHRVSPEVAMSVFFMTAIGYAEVCGHDARMTSHDLKVVEVTAEQLVDIFLQGI